MHKPIRDILDLQKQRVIFSSYYLTTKEGRKHSMWECLNLSDVTPSHTKIQNDTRQVMWQDELAYLIRLLGAQNYNVDDFYQEHKITMWMAFIRSTKLQCGWLLPQLTLRNTDFLVLESPNFFKSGYYYHKINYHKNQED